MKRRESRPERSRGESKSRRCDLKTRVSAIDPRPEAGRGRIKRKKQSEEGRLRNGEEIYANDLEQDYKMASLTPVTVLNFARCLLSSLALSLSLPLSFSRRLRLSLSPTFFSFLHLLLLLRASAIFTYCYAGSSLLTELKGSSSPCAQRKLPGDDSRILLRDDSDEYGRRDAPI